MLKRSRNLFGSSSRLALCMALVLLLSISTVNLASAPAATDGAPSIIVMYADDAMTASDFRQLAKDGHAPSDIDVVNERLIEVHLPKGADANKAVRNALNNPSVVAAAENRRIEALSIPPNDPLYTHSAYPAIGQRIYLGPASVATHSIDIESVWQVTRDETSGFAMNRYRRGVTMAIIDTGVSIPLMEDTGRFVPVRNYVPVVPNTNTSDDSRDFHGTAVASVIAANTNNAFAIAGTLYDLENSILVYKVLDRANQGHSIDVMEAMMDAANRGARVINASLGEPAITANGQPDQNARALWQEVVNYCISRGALVVAAAGNKGEPVLYPAACEGALAVGSINPATGQRSTFPDGGSSNFGPELDVVAAGNDIWTVRPSGEPARASGTSLATPLVAGSIAYLWSLVPDLTPQDMLSFAQTTAVGTYGPNAGFDNETGFGKFDSRRLFEHMQQVIDIQDPVTLTASPVSGREVRLSWSPAEGKGVFYLYGYEGGDAYQTTSTSGRLVLPADGPNTVWVRPFASDRWSAQQPATASASVTTGSHAINSSRLEGANRFRTALAISQASFPATSSSAVIASGENWPDGLAGGVLASASNGPLLLTRANRLSLEVRDEILRLRPQRIYILGGTGAISSAVENAIRSLPGTSPPVVERLWGHDRYATAARIAERVRSYTGPATGNRVVVASGENFPDALSGSALAASARIPILLARRTALTTPTAGALRTIAPAETLVLGGTGVISQAVHDSLPRPYRIWGIDRYETSRKIAEYGLGGPAPMFDAGRLGFATGTAFPDALAAGQLLGKARTPIILTDQAPNVVTGLTGWLGAPGRTVGNVTFLGGAGAIGYDLEFGIRNSLLRSP